MGVISVADFEQMQAMAASATQAVAGMSPAEAAAAMNAVAAGGATGAKIISFARTGSEAAGNVVNFPNAANAAAAMNDYLALNGATAASNAATSAVGEGAQWSASYALGNTGIAGAATKVYGVLSTTLPTAAAALAPIAGVALGAGLYKLNPDFWTKVSQKLLPFAWDNTDILPSVVDENGNVYYPQDALDVLKDLFSSLTFSSSATITDTTGLSQSVIDSLPVLYGDADNLSFTGAYNSGTSDNPSAFTNIVGSSPVYTIVFAYNDNLSICAFSKTPFSLRYSTHNEHGTWSQDFKASNNPFNNKDVYYVYADQEFLYNTQNITIPLFHVTENSAFHRSQYFYVALYGDVTSQSSEAGVDSWTGHTIPEGTTGLQILTGYDADGNPIYTNFARGCVPWTVAGVSPDPSVNPDPWTVPDPAPQIEPWIDPNPWPSPDPWPVDLPLPSPNPAPSPLPTPIPSPNPTPIPSPDFEPDDDSTIDPLPDPKPDPPPVDGGVSPEPVPPVIVTPIASGDHNLINVYNPTAAQIKSFGQWLWTTFSGDLLDTLSKLFNNPMDAVIGLHELYIKPDINGNNTIKCGYLDSGVNSAVVGKRYTSINCGSIVVPEYYRNYLDYAPYTQTFIYLPFIGIVPVAADDIVGNAVSIRYNVDSYTGCCIALIEVAKKGYQSTVYQFQGNCGVEIPITSGYQSALVGSMLGVAGTAIGGSAGAILGAAGRAGSVNSVQRSGSFGASYGAMGAKKPYIIVKRPVQKVITNYNDLYGYPAHKYVSVGNCKGYLRCREVDVKSSTATNEEKAMIEHLLKTGVYVK